MTRSAPRQFAVYCILVTAGIGLILCGAPLLIFIGFALAVIAQSIITLAPSVRKRDGIIVAVFLAVALLALVAGLPAGGVLTFWPVPTLQRLLFVLIWLTSLWWGYRRVFATKKT